ncbi:MAG: hypothetical protein HDQ88_02985 [Clostridia bacterium]|nr:hypothetical protein [Clostridia bacterium]
MKDGLYHYEVFWKDEIQNQIDIALNSGLPFKFDKHATDNKFKRSISIDGITTEKLKKGYCFEAEVKNDKVVKFVIRYGYNDTYDLVTVWNPRAKCLYCKTIWLNEKDDKHITLDESKYVAYYDDENEHHVGVCLGDLINQNK